MTAWKALYGPMRADPASYPPRDLAGRQTDPTRFSEAFTQRVQDEAMHSARMLVIAPVIAGVILAAEIALAIHFI